MKTIKEKVLEDIEHDCKEIPMTYSEECIAKGAIDLTLKHVKKLIDERMETEPCNALRWLKSKIEG